MRALTLPLDAPTLANMKLRHTAALALVGWYLLAPPLIGPRYTVKVDAPFSQWAIAQTLDIASDCESEKAARRAKVLANLGNPALLSYCQDCFLECVATNDPRLNH